MTPNRFDDLTKAAAFATSRRQTFRTLVGTAAAGFLAALGGMDQASAAGKPGGASKPTRCIPNGKRCNKNTPCCTNYCDNSGKCAVVPGNRFVCSCSNDVDYYS